MQPGVQALLSGALTMGVPLVLAVRELVVMRRYNGRWGDWRDPAPPKPTSPRLPPCLLVPPRTRPTVEPEIRSRVPELVG